VGQDVVVALDDGIRRVDVYGTELIAEEALGDEIAANCLLVGAKVSVDCEEIDCVAVAFPTDEGINVSVEAAELPVRTRVPNAESVMVMGKSTPDDCHSVCELVSTTCTTVSTTVVVGVCASCLLDSTTTVASGESSQVVFCNGSHSFSLDRISEAKTGSCRVSTPGSRFESTGSSSLASSRCFARMSLLMRSWRWP
jgi:hypothetical protein